MNQIQNSKVAIEDTVNFDDFQTEQAKKIISGKHIFLGKMTWKQRLAAIIAFLILKFTTDLKWQMVLFLYLLLALPIGTYQIIKWFYHLFL